MIKLKSEATGVQEFEHLHAQRILAHEAKYKMTNWELADDSYEFKNGNITKRASRGAANKATEQNSDSSSD